MLREKLWDCEAPPAPFLADADEEKHEHERLERAKRLRSEWRVEPCANKHRHAEGGHSDENRESQRKSVPARVNAEAHQPREQFLDARSSAQQGSSDEGCREHSQGVHTRSARH